MSKKIVVIDDSKFIIKQIKTFFENEMKYSVVDIGYDGNDAVQLYRQHQPDLITIDITMPNKSGEEALREILSEFPDANILMISAVRGDAMLDCMNMGAKGFVEKPLKFNSAEFTNDFKETLSEIFTQE